MKTGDRFMFLMFFCFIMGWTSYTQVLVLNLRQEVRAMAKDTEEGIDGLHLLHEQRGVNIYTIQDTLVRIYHYTQPHKGKIQGCPECFKQVEGRRRDLAEPFEEPVTRCGTPSPTQDEMEEVERKLEEFRRAKESWPPGDYEMPNPPKFLCVR